MLIYIISYIYVYIMICWYVLYMFMIISNTYICSVIISWFAAYSIAGKSHKHTHIIQYIHIITTVPLKSGIVLLNICRLVSYADFSSQRIDFCSHFTNVKICKIHIFSHNSLNSWIETISTILFGNMKATNMWNILPVGIICL